MGTAAATAEGVVISHPESDEECLACLPVLSQLRPQLTPEVFLPQLRRMQAEGFRLCVLAEDGVVRAVAGYRFMEMFSTGRILYVDDLVTDAASRSRGHGRALLDWLQREAEAQECRYLELDSGTTRVDAHRFYERHGLEKVAFKFSIPCAGVEAWKSPG
ncbi:MAG: GNAT family N-acetyltransferase [Myxococcaceae bacterium]